MAYNPVNVNGQATAANSAPVVLASDQSALSVTPVASQVQDLFITGLAGMSALGDNVFSSTGGTAPIDTMPTGSSTHYRSFYTSITFGTGVTSGGVIFEGSNDATNWFTLTAFDDTNSMGQPFAGTLNIGAPTTVFRSGKTMYRYIRLRIATAITGGTVQAFTKLSPLDYVPRFSWSIQNQASNMQVSTPDVLITGAAAQSVLGNNIMLSTTGTTSIDTLSVPGASIPMRSFYCQINISAGVSAGAFIFESSNDGVTWINQTVFDDGLISGQSVNSGALTPAANTVRFFSGKCTYRFLRCRIFTAFVGGTVQATTLFSPVDYVPRVTPVVQQTAANLNATVSGTVGVTGYPAAAASADFVANPTVTQIGAAQLQFNGASWDRERNNAISSSILTGPVTATTTGAVQNNFNAAGVVIQVNVGAPTGTSPTLNLQLQVSLDSQATWINWGPATANITAAGNIVIACYPSSFGDLTTGTLSVLTTGATASRLLSAPLPRAWRVVATAGGTTPSWPITNATANYIL